MRQSETSPLDNKADIYAWGIVGTFMVLSLLIEGTTEQMEIARNGAQDAGELAAEWLYEISSHAVLVLVTAIIPFGLNRFPLSLSNWPRRLPHYAALFLLFSAVHILLMVAVRQAVWPMISDGQYEFGLLRIEPWAYEMRKDLFTFLSLLGVFITSRHIVALDEERKAALADAQATGQLTLKSGGRQILVPADEVVHASAAGNYVELHTLGGRHFVRLTLSELYKLLAEAGAQPVRLHRSHLTVQQHLREVGPLSAVLSTGMQVPIGRSYRRALS